MKKLLIIPCLLAFTATFGQSVDEVLDTYFENIGGKENLAKVKGTKMTAKVNQGGLEIPLEMVQLADGKQYTKFSLQGNEFFQNVYDGETLWSINFQSMKAEKMDAEQTANYKLDINDFPDVFLNYKEKGYQIEMVGEETIDGAETFKLKVVKEPKMLDGKEVEDVSYYYFDKEAFVPLAIDSEIKSGQAAGMISRTTFSDYQEVDGIYFAFSIGQGVKGGESNPINIDEIVLNPKVDEKAFAFPAN